MGKRKRESELKRKRGKEGKEEKENNTGCLNRGWRTAHTHTHTGEEKREKRGGGREGGRAQQKDQLAFLVSASVCEKRICFRHSSVTCSAKMRTISVVR